MQHSHPTLRFADIFPPRRHSLREFHAPARVRLTYNGRGAFYQLLRSLPQEKGSAVLLPAFHCTALVEPVQRAGYQVRFYRIRPDLTVDFEDVNQKMSSQIAAIVAIHYFGFPTPLDPFLELGRKYGSRVVEDCAHSFLSRQSGNYVGHRGDFAIFSYYKFAPSLAGGGLGINHSECSLGLSAAPILLRDRLIVMKRLAEQVLENAPGYPLTRIFFWTERKRVQRKSSADANASPSRFVDDPYLFREDLALAGMPRLCRFVLECCDWEKIREARQRNYRLFSELIVDNAFLRRLFPDLPGNVCPWAFPILLEDRLLHEQTLRAQGVPLFTFGEILHPLLAATQDGARGDAEYLSRRLLLLPVDAQQSEQDVRVCAEKINEYARAFLDSGGCADANGEATTLSKGRAR